ncbi:MSHA biogenesis protein MshI [Thalassotalea hakodatensis]|uniref:MSHA biogenesis protein MshI n=1 Tax=Thalassotalea hakodatensis TaxID=3030492 RepID=UPI0025742E2B|nr:MSHA biogenesis protein MshI [Thalassotalea hakodatensis]
MSLASRIQQVFKPHGSSNIVGLSLQQRSIHLCSLDHSLNARCKLMELTDGDFNAAFTRVHQKYKPSGQCHLVLSSKHNQVVQIDKPALPEEEINSALKWQIKDLVSIPPENMVIDYFDAPKTSNDSDKIHVICAAKDMLATWLTSLNTQQLSVASITIEEFAFAALMPNIDDAKILLCQQPNEDMLLLIVKQGRLYFQRRLRGMAQIGEKTEQELSFGTIDSLSLEIQRSMDYFERQMKQAPIKSIEVLVPIENEAYLARCLAENANVAVNLFTMPEGFEPYRTYAASLGATRIQAMSEVVDG